MDKVFWMDMRAKPGASLETKFNRLLKKLGVAQIVSQGALVAVKVHVGERGNLAYVNPNYARLTADEIRHSGGRPFFTDTNTLYCGGRHNAVEHNETAAMHGYFSASAGAPFVAADGLRGLDWEEAPVTAKHCTRARLGSAIYQADALVMLSHFKGHCETRFGGTIKNMGMGCAAVPGKLELHSGSKPVQYKDKCVACGQCIRRCPEKAISLETKKAVIEYERCVGCGQCVAACNYNAIQVKWETHGVHLIEKIAEYAWAIGDRFKERARYINFALTISPDCDCWDFNDTPFIQDVGIFASANPLALDRATLDMVNKAPRLSGTDFDKADPQKANVFDALRPRGNSMHLFEYCKTLGMDDRYELEKID